MSGRRSALQTEKVLAVAIDPVAVGLVEEALSGVLAPVAAEIRGALLPSVRLRRANAGEDAVGRIGGLPRLSEGTAWPRFQDRGLGFLAEIDLARIPTAIPERALLPSDGHLSFFFDLHPEHQPWGFDPRDCGSSRVLYTPADAKRREFEVPSDVPADNRYEEGALAARVEITLPSPEALSAPAFEVPGDQWTAYLDLLQALTDHYDDDGSNITIHRLFGHPDQIQGEMQTDAQLASNGLYLGDSTAYDDPRAKVLRADARSWHLLLQLDSDDSEGEVMWGDGGRIYFWAHERDLEQDDFSRVWTILQCT